MTHQSTHYKDWLIQIYYNVRSKNAEYLIDELMEIGCSGKELERVNEVLTNMQFNQGLTYANMDTKEVIIIVGEADSKKEFLDTVMHELYHCSMFITIKDGSSDPEYPAYVLGHLTQKVYRTLHSFLCEKCH